jgi:hypothetical protein
MDSTIMEPKRKLIPLTVWPNIHSYPPLGQLRALVFNADKNGFNRCIRRIGKRILIDEAQFFSWVDEQKFNQDNA